METLGAHLRNLLTPYKTLLTAIEKGQKLPDSFLKSCFDNLYDLVEFSNSEKMEKNTFEK